MELVELVPEATARRDNLRSPPARERALASRERSKSRLLPTRFLTSIPNLYRWPRPLRTCPRMASEPQHLRRLRACGGGAPVPCGLRQTKTRPLHPRPTMDSDPRLAPYVRRRINSSRRPVALGVRPRYVEALNTIVSSTSPISSHRLPSSSTTRWRLKKAR